MEARNRKVLLAAAVGLVLAAGPGPAHADGGPAGQIRGTIDNVIAILKRTDPRPAERPEQRRALLRRQISAAFDFEEMSKRSLGLEWRRRTPDEREAFVRLFTQLLENAYLGKIEAYRGEEVRYVGETIDPPYAVVRTAVVTSRGQEIPIAYRMLRGGDRWRVYDVTIEGVSLVNNYRSQFNAILRKSSFSEMMDRLRDTIRKQES